jgi:hypothetical protein
MVKTSAGLKVVRTSQEGEGVVRATVVKKGGDPLMVIAVYAVPGLGGAPTLVVQDRLARTEAALDRIVGTVVASRTKGVQVAVVGDLNGRVGESGVVLGVGTTAERFVARVSQDKKVNPRGREMLRRCEEAGMVMLNGLKQVAAWTRVMDGVADAKGSSVCDWICVGEEAFEASSAVRVCERDNPDWLNVETYHLLVSATVVVGRGGEDKEEQGQQHRVLWALEDGGDAKHWNALAGECKAMAEEWKTDGDLEAREPAGVEATWARFKAGAHACLEKGVGKRKRRRREMRRQAGVEFRALKAHTRTAREAACSAGRGTSYWTRFRGLHAEEAPGHGSQGSVG